MKIWNAISALQSFITPLIDSLDSRERFKKPKLANTTKPVLSFTGINGSFLCHEKYCTSVLERLQYFKITNEAHHKQKLQKKLSSVRYITAALIAVETFYSNEEPLALHLWETCSGPERITQGVWKMSQYFLWSFCSFYMASIKEIFSIYWGSQLHRKFIE